MARKIYDLAVKTGEYTNQQGETKGRYENIGAMMENDNGKFVMLKRTFNPAGVNTDRDSILVSMFEPRQRDGGQGSNQGQSGGYDQSPQGYGGGYGAGGRPGGGVDDDEIPFQREWRV